MKKVSQKDLEQVIGGILELAEKEREESESYKSFEKLDGVYEILEETHDRMIKTVLDTAHLLKKKFGFSFAGDKGTKAYDMLMSFPLIISKTEDIIREKEGSVCCVDKTWSRTVKAFCELAKPKQ